jgi:hypothetical protein
MVFLGVEPRSVGVVLAQGLCDFGGGSLRLKTSVMGRRAVPLFSLRHEIALQLRKSMENLSQGRGAATGLLDAPTWLSFEGLPRLACWTSDHHSFPNDFSQPSVGTGAFRVVVLWGSPHQLTSSRNSRSML